jgi:hypothetical protein
MLRSNLDRIKTGINNSVAEERSLFSNTSSTYVKSSYCTYDPVIPPPLPFQIISAEKYTS